MKVVCTVREIYKALGELEGEFLRVFDVGINEMIVICAVSENKISASNISEKTGIKASHLSKILKSLEEKGFVIRFYGKSDKRQMYFQLSDKGEELLESYGGSVEIPEILRPIFAERHLY